MIFTPTPHQVIPGATVTTGFTIADTNTAGVTTTDSITSVVATAAADSPVINGIEATQATTDAAPIGPFANVVITDANFSQLETVTVQQDLTANGTLSDPNSAADGSTISNGVFTITGNAATVTTALDDLSFTPTQSQVAPGNTVATTFTIGVIDSAGETATGTTTLVTTATNPVIGTPGNDTLFGTVGDDLIDGEGGDDTVTGGGGYDTYIFNSGYGTLTINNGLPSETVPEGQLKFGLGLDQTDLWFAQSANNLVIDVLGTNESITVNGWFGSNPSADLVEIVGGNGARIDTAVGQLTAAMATFQINNPNFNPVTAAVMPTDPILQSALAVAWHN